MVFARKRDETAISTPVVVTAVTGENLEKQGIDNLTELPQMVPQLQIQTNGSGFGGSITLRGVSSPTSSVAIDQAVSLNLDGVPVSYGGVVRMGFFDVQQIEVLKGPQALFFGKNASGGIISLRSAGPTKEFESRAKVSYEFGAEEIVGEAYVAGPINEVLGARLAVRYTDQEGYIENIIPVGTPGTFGPANKFGPGTEEIAARGTLRFEPNDVFSAEFKLGYTMSRDNAAYMQLQRIACPYGIPAPPGAIPGAQDCSADDRVERSDLDPTLAALDPRFGDGVPFEDIEQILGTLDINYNLTDAISINSVTGYYDLRYELVDAASFGLPLLSSASLIEKSTWSEEIRVFSENSGRFNWMFGGFFQLDEFSTVGTTVIGRAAAPVLVLPTTSFSIDSTTVSGFAQATFDLTDTLELSAGARYTYEKRKQDIASVVPSIQAQLTANLPDQRKFHNLSPEATLTWRPSSALTIFGSYKTGYKSGGFQVGMLDAGPALRGPFDNSFDEETVTGGELGLKTALLDRSLMINMAVYRYAYEDLQLSSFEAQSASTTIANVTGSVVRGVELDFNYKPYQIRGLAITGAVAFNESFYKDFLGDCYTGQTIAEGCSAADTDSNGRFDKQDLTGRTLPRAPKWASSLGFTYEKPLMNDFLLTVGSSATYTGRYSYMQQLQPESFQDGVTKIDAFVSFGPANGSWEIGFLGRNLTEEYQPTSGAGVPLTGNPQLTGTSRPGGKPDVFGSTNRGREYWIRFTVRPDLLLN